MLNDYKDFLLNMFFVASPLVFYPYILKTKNKPLLYGLFLYLVLAVSLICTMSFSVQIEGLSYDFRSVLLTVSFIYAGPFVSLLLYFTLIVCRFALGNPNNLLYAVSLLPSVILFLLLRKHYASVSAKRKTFSAALICTFIKFLTIFAYLGFLGDLVLWFKSPLDTLGTYLVQALTAAAFVCLMELANKYFVMQEEIVASEKMKIVSDIAASVAHEIRNPLTSVRGFIQLLGNGDLPLQRREYYRNICLDELDRAQNIISDYLTLAKPDPEVVERIDLKEEVEYVSQILLAYANYNNVVIQTQLCDEAYAEGDRHKLRQALINIGKNVIEAMPGGGQLLFALKKTNGGVVLTVSDTGVGMTPEQISRLGTPYYSTKEKGTGLGTMVSFGIIKKMHGKIEIKSELGVGTEYHIIFAA
ncbi:sensor histidine kinase [Cohnella sp. CFH 77786]|uniref:ATP-binding protein n=1 Tax=Cohnella sp. CFH 77786 TaxID=2662265 RepID=UPI001C60CF7B|nr:sensor histidine kinase [Cohnella sp. CFH 77786]